ncbi:MAG TPA: FkbM family methyltransferase [Thermoanaerobaculia bacterium]|nr:FkbM family methyltransferase [Thermoanaerobaculia bacterium]
MKRSLIRAGVLPRRLLDSCLRWQSRSAGLASIHGHHLFAPGLASSSVVIDAGAHVGEFSREMVERFGCLCYALEPVPELFGRIPEHPRVRRFPLALGGSDGEVVLHLSGNPQANSVHAAIAEGFGSRGTVVASLTSLERFLERIGVAEPDLLKLDIEGSEIAVLESASDGTLRRIGQITVEFHDFLDGFRDGAPIAALKRRLERAGFLCVVASRPGGDHSDTLFINRRRHRLGLVPRIHLFLMRHVTLELRRLLHRVRALLS